MKICLQRPSIRLAVVAALYLVTGSEAGVEIRRAGWLDRVVAYHKEKFIKDVEKFAPVNINVTLTKAPPDFVDSQEWDYNSVIRLLALIRESETPVHVRRELRRMLKPTRRIMMSVKESMKFFPSLSKLESNSFYYDIEYYDSEELPPPPRVPEDEVVVVVSNPVEARLPSARISVKLLREILLARAIAARAMPSTEKSTIPWIPMNKTNAAATSAAAPSAAAPSAADPSAGGSTTDATDNTT
ncbi:uncharacterized protein LOC113508925 [Trichoplusia ni]|uniref:Uncharacterized protein LOC113508925 n=1 Tax=Trichoplusia ni TaxID=7111 RepID=A0A7E5X5A1_TRINI|nr:uncharacterized protein LOC113508925 [Trichoplusia ni]